MPGTPQPAKAACYHPTAGELPPNHHPCEAQFATPSSPAGPIPEPPIRHSPFKIGSTGQYLPHHHTRHSAYHPKTKRSRFASKSATPPTLSPSLATTQPIEPHLKAGWHSRCRLCMSHQPAYTKVAVSQHLIFNTASGNYRCWLGVVSHTALPQGH